LTAAVVDASIVLAWLFSESARQDVMSAFVTIQHGEATAPIIIDYEIRNGLLVAERRGRISREQSNAFLNRLAMLAIRLKHPGSDETMALARTHDLTFYDALYLQLARCEGLPLATLDRALERAARAEGVALFGA
jgi:predicted nucleic acid-binding protein